MDLYVAPAAQTVKKPGDLVLTSPDGPLLIVGQDGKSYPDEMPHRRTQRLCAEQKWNRIGRTRAA